MTNGNGNVAKSEICKQRYDINRPRPIDGPKYTKYKMCPSIMMVICIKQLLSNILSSTQEKVKKHWGWVETSVGYKKRNSVVVFIDINKYILTEPRHFKAFLKCNYVLDSCYLFTKKNVEYGIEHVVLIVLMEFAYIPELCSRFDYYIVILADDGFDNLLASFCNISLGMSNKWLSSRFTDFVSQAKTPIYQAKLKKYTCFAFLFQVLKVLLVKIRRFSHHFCFFLMFADIIFYKSLELHSILSEKVFSSRIWTAKIR